jgi:glucose-1-phosphate thymidylyltransferase
VLATTAGLPTLDQIFIVTNEKFAGDFEAWGGDYRRRHSQWPPITVVNDHSTDDTNKLGVIGDTKLVIDSQKVDDDLMIIDGDNLFKSSLAAFAKFADGRGPTLGVYDIGDPKQMKKYGDVSVDGTGQIPEFVEKPP